MPEQIKMPCGSPHSCLNCRHFFMVTDPCTYLKRMSEQELDRHLEVLKEQKKLEKKEQQNKSN